MKLKHLITPYEILLINNDLIICYDINDNEIYFLYSEYKKLNIIIEHHNFKTYKYTNNQKKLFIYNKEQLIFKKINNKKIDIDNNYISKIELYMNDIDNMFDFKYINNFIYIKKYFDFELYSELMMQQFFFNYKIEKSILYIFNYKKYF